MSTSCADLVFFSEGGEGPKNNCVCRGGGWVKSPVLVKLLSEVNFNLPGRSDPPLSVLDPRMIFKITGITKRFTKAWSQKFDKTEGVVLSQWAGRYITVITAKIWCFFIINRLTSSPSEKSMFTCTCTSSSLSYSVHSLPWICSSVSSLKTSISRKKR